MVMVQDEKSAKYGGMPRSAIATGLADYVMPVEKMPEQLIKYTKHAITAPKIKITRDEEAFQKTLQKIFIILRSRTKHDFSLYKANTICRRIERRMHVHQIDDIKYYVKYLQKSEHEVHVLFKDLLIGVTSFFRDPKAFDLLKDNFLQNILNDKPEDYTFRVWTAGCSTGEEAYSLAIILQECLEKLNRHIKIQIFATDIDEDAIITARAALYPLSTSTDVSPERLKRFFTKEENHFRVKKSIREMLVFAPQNIIKDPPFTKLDMLSCRNLLIYLGPELQKKLLPMFHYSLKPGGILFLGSSESIGRDINLFKLEDKKWKIFSRLPLESTGHPILDFPSSTSPGTAMETKIPDTLKKSEDINIFMLVETILQQSSTPPCVIIDENANIVYTHGRTGRYLEPAIGRVSLNILDMARPGLKTVLAGAIRKASALKHEVSHKAVEVKDNGGFTRISLRVKPLMEHGANRGMIMVIFDDAAPKAPGSLKVPGSGKNQEVDQLEKELQYTKENLQTTIEELETSNEELKSTNEELQSTNEELQSTNEELETSKEELQSLNEESATVNAELQSRIDELSDANDDMKNLLDSTQIGTIFLDIDLKVRRFTTMVKDLVPLASTDIGRPISHFSTVFKEFNIVKYSEKVLSNLVTREFEVESRDNKFFRTRIMPYRTMQNVIDGVVITFEDITEFKRMSLISRRLASLVMDSDDAIIIQDKDGNIIFWNSGAGKDV